MRPLGLNFYKFCEIIKIRKFNLSISQPFHISSKQQKAEENNAKKIDLASFPLEAIRNFSIIAHIDHGKSTLADRILEFTGAIKKDVANKQVLDKLQVEKERGITVKAQSASIVFNHNGKNFLLNLIDTPGHVDFSYEVAKSLSACQGVILLVDANQGVQAQTVAHFYLAFTNELVIIPVLNKIDLKNAQPELVTEQLMNTFNMDPEEVLKVSAKLGSGINEMLQAVVDRIPSPATHCNPNAPTRALLFDSWYDKYKGVICQVQVIDGVLQKGDCIQSYHTKKQYEVKDIAYLSPEEVSVPALYSGQVGIITAKIRNTSEAQVGDTFYLKGQAVEPLRGFKESKPMVFAGVYPMETKDQLLLKAAIDRLSLNDSSVSVSTETSEAFGQGWRVGFLGLLHMEVFNERLEHEYGMPVVVTTPSVTYKIRKSKPPDTSKRSQGKSNEAEEIIVSNPAQWPENTHLIETFEPIVRGTIITPGVYIASIMSLCEGRRGQQLDMKELDNQRFILVYHFPLNEIVVDFFDILKSTTSGYATFDYEHAGYVSSDLVKVGIKLNGNLIEELSIIAHKSQAEARGRQICLKLCQTLPRHLFQIAVQAVIGGKVIARENIRALKKDVLAKCYGGDITRKMKLLKQQAEGKKRMKMIGNIEIPRDTFIAVLKK